MALNDNALTSLSSLKLYLGITTTTNDSLLESIIGSISDFVENYCNRTFKKTFYSDELYDGTGTLKLVLNNYPVVTGETFTLKKRTTTQNIDSFNTVNGQNYFVKESQGLIVFNTGCFEFFPQHYSLSYTAGYDYDVDSAPLSSLGAGDLELSVWKLCARAYKSRKNAKDVKSEKIGDYSIAYNEMLIGIIKDSEIRGILDTYKRIIIG